MNEPISTFLSVICHATTEDFGRTQKVTMRADITQQDKKKRIMKTKDGIGGRATPSEIRLHVCISSGGCGEIKVATKRKEGRKEGKKIMW